MNSILRPARAAGTHIASWRERRLSEPGHSDKVAAVLGIALGVSFLVCFATGLLSHLIQHPPGWFTWTARPAGLYRFSQGLHIATGIASVPLLFAKLWSVFPRLFSWPLFDDALHALERLSLLPLVGGSLFMLVTGVANIELWYPWVFFFPAGHYAVSWVVMGAMVIHLAAKAPSARRSLRRGRIEPVDLRAGRRGFLGLAFATSAGLVAVTAGQTVSPLRRLALLAPRRPDIGVQGFPVNKTAREARIDAQAIGEDFRLTVESGGHILKTFSLAELGALEVRTAELPIACVEGWSTNQTWAGVAVRDVLAAAGVPPDATLRVESLQRGGRYRTSLVNRGQVADFETMLATHVNGEPLVPDHGFPLRLIGPNRPGVQQTKWIAKLVIL
jgi:DMSO/TMAO reductase YedYZ molybdopterin-dependent catalytic subunit